MKDFIQQQVIHAFPLEDQELMHQQLNVLRDKLDNNEIPAELVGEWFKMKDEAYRIFLQYENRTNAFCDLSSVESSLRGIILANFLNKNLDQKDVQIIRDYFGDKLDLQDSDGLLFFYMVLMGIHEKLENKGLQAEEEVE